MKLVFFIICDNVCDAKEVSKLMKNSIKRKYVSNGSYSGDGNVRNDIDNVMAAKASTAAIAVLAGTTAMASKK